MVVKTELCAFSEYRIYPGHGIKFIRRDGQPVQLSSSKTRRLSILNKKKSSKLMWTQAWRRLNKKGKDEGISRKRTRKAVKIQRAVGGVSVEALKKKIQPVKPKSAATEAALKEIKDRQKAAKKANAVTKGPTGGANIPKLQPKSTNARGGAKR